MNDTGATIREARREGLRRAMELYLAADKVFNEAHLRNTYLASIASELRRLVRSDLQ